MVTPQIADTALQMMEIDQDGLDELDTRLLEMIIHKYQGGPVGIQSLSVAIGEDAGTIEEVCEPYLIMCGFIHRTPQGRVATTRAYEKFGLSAPKKNFDLFGN
jgi:Holliday junction DNA helicase RuvB